MELCLDRISNMADGALFVLPVTIDSTDPYEALVPDRFKSLHFTHRAEAATQQARTQAEALLGYLSDDFATQLETYGQMSSIADISRRQIDYFHGLPPRAQRVRVDPQRRTRHGQLRPRLARS